MKHHALLIEAIANLRPGSEVTVYTNDAGDEDTVVVHDSTVLPSESDILAECKRMEDAGETNSDYKINRREAYGDIGDQLDKIYWDQINSTTVWRDSITAVKNKFSK